MAIHTSHRQTVEPTNVVKLMEALGPTRAAARLGVSTTLLHKSRKEGEVNKVVETAAAYALEHVAEKPAIPAPRAVRGKESLFLIAVPTDKAETLQRVASALGAELVAA
jgi:hypothetical protein